jgi:hypothetical protein
MLIKIYENIDKDTKFTCDNVYIIIGEIRVLPDITLIIEDSVNILIMNGDLTIPEGVSTRKSCLIFETGSTLYSEYSGDDGFDIENSDITCLNITVKIPNEDGINITSSRVNVIESLIINMTINETFDRDIFDLETDDGPAFIRIAQNCLVKIDGIFGDQLTLVSDDLPQPVITPEGKELPYNFNGYTVKGQSYVYSGFFSL